MRSAQLSSSSSASSSSSSAAARPLSSVMFSLLMGLWNYLFSKAELHLLIVGLDDAGKTTLLEQLKGIFGKKPGIPLDKIPPTVGLNIARVDIQRCRIIFWDLGGQERLRVIWSKYYSESHGIVFVLDSVNERRFEEAKQTLQTMLEHSELRAIPLLLLANKKDLENAIGVNAMRDLMAVDTHSGPVGAYATCALTREGIEESMNWFVDTVKNSDRFYQRQSSSSTS